MNVTIGVGVDHDPLAGKVELSPDLLSHMKVHGWEPTGMNFNSQFPLEADPYGPVEFSKQMGGGNGQRDRNQAFNWVQSKYSGILRVLDSWAVIKDDGKKLQLSPHRISTR